MFVIVVDLKYTYRPDIQDRAALDDLIAAQSAKIEALKTQKEGFMQQLFPAPEGEA